jgi:hypothetical protein
MFVGVSMNKNVVAILEDIVNSKIEDYSIPHVRGNSIRIKHIVVRHSKKINAWLVYDTIANVQIAKMFCKTGAIALAKSIADDKQQTAKIQYLDTFISKHYNDCIFYKHTMDVTEDSIKYETAQSRFAISIDLTRHAKEELEQIILS